jgi:hypothetical protein
MEPFLITRLWALIPLGMIRFFSQHSVVEAIEFKDMAGKFGLQAHSAMRRHRRTGL